jgi:hypothetical protein
MGFAAAMLPFPPAKLGSAEQLLPQIAENDRARTLPLGD